MANARSRPSNPVVAALELVGLTVLAFLVSLVAGVAFIVPMYVLGYDIQSTTVLLGTTAAGQVAFLGLGYGYVRVRDVDVPVEVPSGRGVLTIAGGTVAALVVATVLSVVLATLDLVPESVVDEIATNDPTFLLGLAALSVLVVAPAEELLFRGAIQGRLRQRFGPVPAIAGSSLLFGSMHLANYTGDPAPVVAGALLIACVGAVLGALYEYTDNLVIPVLTHMTYNVILLVLSYLAL